MSGLLAEVREALSLPAPPEARRIRERAGVTQERLAAELEVHPLTVLHWETGQRTPRGKNRIAYGRLLRELDTIRLSECSPETLSDGYNVAMDQSSWELRLTGVIASQMRQWRDKRGLSMQRLADHTAELGTPIPRNVLANLESGRRDWVSVTEVLILAKALNAAPVDLLFPAEADDEVEVAPGEFLSRDRAFEWFTTAQCLTCDGKPTAGFTCNACGRSG